MIPGITEEDLRPDIYVKDEAFMPRVAHQGDAGADLKINLEGYHTLKRNLERCLMFTQDGQVYLNGKAHKRYKLLGLLDGREPETEEEQELIESGVSYSSTSLLLEPGRGSVVGTGVFIKMPSLERFGPYVPMLALVPRSGLGGKMKITLSNSPATIDQPYIGEIKLGLINHSEVPHLFTHGARCAQMIYKVVVDQKRVGFNRVMSLDEFGKTERNAGGFGSTGV